MNETRQIVQILRDLSIGLCPFGQCFGSTFIPTHLVPIEPVHVTLSGVILCRKNVVDFKIFHLKIPNFEQFRSPFLLG